MQIIISEGAMLLAQLMISNAIRQIFNSVSAMTPEEIAALTPFEQARNRAQITEVEGH